MKRVHLIISGDVQGVGYRAWAKRQAQALHLVGWVKNREDKAVEIVAEGARSSIEEFVKRTNHGPEISGVARVDTDWEEQTGEFVSFEVLY